MTETVPTDDKDVLFVVTYGSKLYGTNTPTSDTDLKSIYLPSLDRVLLGKKMPATKKRFDAEGGHVQDHQSMPDGGLENEFIPFQTFVRDFVQGQTYAVECAFAILRDGPSRPDSHGIEEYNMIVELVEQFANSEVYSMVGFAQKQTFDYVRRGERLNEAKKVMAALQHVLDVNAKHGMGLRLRLDTLWTSTEPKQYVLDAIAQETGLKISSTVNNNKEMRTLELNGRSYLETTVVEHLVEQVQKLIDKYGERSTAASQTDVDFKSISHAYRVYQQAIEILETGKVTFPRPNHAQLLEIKQGRADLEAVKRDLASLDDRVLELMKTTSIQPRTPELEAEAEQWLLAKLRRLYLLD